MLYKCELLILASIHKYICVFVKHFDKISVALFYQINLHVISLASYNELIYTTGQLIVSMMSRYPHIISFGMRTGLPSEMVRSLSRINAVYHEKHNFINKRLMSVQSHRKCNVVVIGGGAVGASTAYWLKKRANRDLSVIVLERDPTVSSFCITSILTH